MSGVDLPESKRPRPVSVFTLQPIGDARRPSAATLLYKGRPVAAIEARVIEAQFRLPDGRALILASNDEPFAERLVVLLLGPDLRPCDSMLLGGATTPGFLAYAEAHGPDEVAFCWHDLEQVVRVRMRRSWFGLRTRWLSLRDLVPQRAPARRWRQGRPAR